MGQTCCQTQRPCQGWGESEGTEITIKPMQTCINQPGAAGQKEHSDGERSKLIKLQRRIRIFLAKRRSLRTYSEMCTKEMNDLDKSLVQSIIEKLGPFYYLSEREEQQMKLSVLEHRPKVTFPDGTSYTGEWRSGTSIREGRGCQVWPDGSFYEGYWQNNMANFYGRLIHRRGDVYQGEWRADKAHGFGQLLQPDGSRYCGYWLNDLQDGHGIENWPDGSKFIGSYQQGDKNGHGEFLWADGNHYRGEFVANNITGQGVYTWADGRRYTGAWRENKMHGYGELEWPDGRKYAGEYSEDQKQGFGTFTWPNGSYYQGNWENGKQHGTGTLSKNGRVRTWKWEKGKKVQELSVGETGGETAATITTMSSYAAH